MSRVVYTLSEEETFELGRRLAAAARPGQILLLQGDLGLGKTVLARGIAAGLGIPPEEVSSPSFTLVNEYRGGRLPMFHVDLYRLDRDDEIATLGLGDLLDASGVVVIEWGERLPPHHRRGALVVRFEDLGDSSRRIELIDAEAQQPAQPADA